MVKLQRDSASSASAGLPQLPLEHGKVATTFISLKEEGYWRYRLSMVKLQPHHIAPLSKDKHSYRLSMVKLQLCYKVAFAQCMEQVTA